MAVLIITGAAAGGATGKQHFGKVGLILGIFFGGLAGWLAALWVRRTFLEF